VRVGVLLAIALLLTACSSGEGTQVTADATSSSRSKQCTQRILAGIKRDRSPMVQSYVQRTYCDQFAKHGWVYEDGTLSIKAHLWAVHGGICREGTAAGPMVTVPCKPSFDPLECALLHFVRRAEAQAYIHQLTKSHRVTCDDGTPLDKIGAT
jgi:hypothetical protein